MRRRDATAADRGDSIATNAAYSMVVKLTTSAFTAATTIFLARYLGPSDYGLFSLALSISLLLVLPSDFGISSSAARFVAEHHGEPRQIARVISAALTLKLAISGTVCALLFALAGPIAHGYGHPGLTWPLRGVALALLGQNTLMLFIAAFSAMRRVALQLRVVFSESVVEAGATVALVLLGAGAAGAAFGRAAGYLLGAAAGLLVTARVLGTDVLPARRRTEHHGRIARYAGSLFLVDAAFTLFEQIDILLIGAYLNASGVGVFQAPLRLCSFLTYPGQSAASAITPRLARTDREEPNVDALARGMHVLTMVQVPIAVGVAVWATPIADLVLGGGYGRSAGVLRALAPYLLLSGLAPLSSLAVNFSGQARRRVPIAVATVGLNLVVDVILIPRIGVVGGAIGTTAAYLIYVPAHLVLCRQIFGLRLAPVAASLARALVAGGAMAAVLALAGTGRLSVAGWLLGGAGGLVAYVLALLAVRAVTPSELQALRARLPGRR